MTLYNPHVQEHYRHPRNLGRLEGATHVVRTFRGDAMLEFHLRVVERRIEAATFRAVGCAGTVAAGSALTEWLVGRTVDEGAAIRARDVERLLRGLPNERRYCAEFAARALHETLGSGP